MFAQILAAYKQSLAQAKIALDDLANFSIQSQSDAERLQNDMSALQQTIGWGNITKEQQDRMATIRAQMETTRVIMMTQLRQIMSSVSKAFIAVPVARQLLAAANARRAPMPNTTVPVKVSSIPSQNVIPLAKTQPPLFLTNNGVWSSAEFVRPRGYIATACATEQTFNSVKPMLLDTLLTVIGSTISIQNTPTESAFIIASGYMYKCHAAITIFGDIEYTWFIDGVPVDSEKSQISSGYYSRDGGVRAATTYIKNDTGGPMLVTLVCIRSRSDSALALDGSVGGIPMDALVEITEIATL